MHIDVLKSNAWVFDVGISRMNRKSGGTAPGWAPHMLVFSAISLLIMFTAGFRLPVSWLIGPMLVVDAISSYAARQLIRKSLLRISRLGFQGTLRARWWIEISGLLCTLTLSAAVMSLVHGLPGVVFPGAKWIQESLFQCTRGLAIGFPIAATIGITIGVSTGQRIHGRSMELVAWFYWSFLLITGFRFIPDRFIVPLGMAAFAVGSAIAFIVYSNQLELYRATGK